MMRRVQRVCFWAVVMGATLLRAQSGEWKLVWADEFDRCERPDPQNWGCEKGFVRNHELQWYQAENATCRDGFLVIEARREPQGKAAAYTSASLTTRGRHAWLYGRFEMRGRIDTSSGMWPAFWTLGTHGPWPSNGEIDVMEFYRGMLLANVAWGTATSNVAEWRTVRKPVAAFGDAEWGSKFHVWRMDWDAEAIELSVDGELMNRVRIGDLRNGDAAGINPFHQPQYLMLNLAIGGDNGGDPAGSKFPARFEVDWVRVYQRQ